MDEDFAISGNTISMHLESQANYLWSWAEEVAKNVKHRTRRH